MNRELTKSSASFFSLALIIFLSIYGHVYTFNEVYSSRRTIVSVDNSGVPIVDYGCQGEVYVGPQRNPITVSHTALSHYDSYNRMKYDRIFLEKLINNSNWLVENAVSKGNYSIFQYQFPWPTYDLQPPWQSGMAQGLALEVLIRAHEITKDKKYLDAAKNLLNAFFVEVKDGGVTYKTPNEGWWYEEYARPGAIESRVLNGHTFALLGIYKYYNYTKDPDAKYLFDQGIISLQNNLPRYEYTGGQYSTYDILNNTIPAPLSYHITHITHLGQLYNITNQEILKNYHDEWTNFRLPESIAKVTNIGNATVNNATD
jgi:heparosan-N-sulfate-glucuronate 5-epimerase